MVMSQTLRRTALDLGVELEYEDVDHVVHEADEVVVERIVEVLADDAAATRSTVVTALHLDPDAPVVTRSRVRDASLLVDGTPATVGVDGARITLPELRPGCHTLQVDTDDGAGECLVVVAPPQMPGWDPRSRDSSLFVPTYALWENDRPLPSFDHLHHLARMLPQFGVDTLATLPLYATFLDEPFDPSPYSPISRLHWNEVYLDDTGLPDEPIPTMTDAVDWRGLAARRRRQLVRAAVDADDALVAELTQFAAAHPDVGSYARFRAQRESSGDLVVERSHVLAQYLADVQLGAIHDDPTAAGLSIDLPIGSHPHGWETWAHPTLFAPSMSIGAPPDTFFTDGQNWGLPPQLPGAMRASGYELWRQMIERAARHASMLRIDHVMAIHRLWWIPDGASADRGVYVRYPHDEMLAVIAASAAAAGVAVVGENLGTVPPSVDAALEKWRMLGMYEEQFAMEDDALATIPARSAAGVRTHDMAAFAEFVDSTDLTAYARLLDVGDEPLLDAVLRRLSSSDAAIVVADLDDLLDERRPHNIPGRVVADIWRRRLDAPLSTTMADERVIRRLRLLERNPR